MENEFGDVETDSTVDNVMDPSDHADFCADAQDKAQEPIMAGSFDAVAAGLWTDADACQAIAPDAGYLAEGFEPFRDPATIQPSVALEAMASRHGTEQSAMDLSRVTHFGLHPLASGAMFMDLRGDQGRELGGFVDLCLPRQHFERAVTSIWGGSMPTTTSAQTITTSTFTSTSVATSAIGGPVHALYARSAACGSDVVRPARQVLIPQPVEPRGSTPKAWPGPGARRSELGTMELSGGICPLAAVIGPSLTGHKLLVGR